MAPAADGRLAILAGLAPLPLLGSVLSVDTQEPWLTCTKWGATYGTVCVPHIVISGDLVFMRILDQEMVVVDSQRIAEALLEKRSRIHSDRPYLATIELYGWSISFAFMGYGDEWRLCRRLFHQTFRSESAVKFRPIQIRRAHEMVVNLVDDPQRYHDHFATFSLSVVMSAAYDYDIGARDDPLVKIVVEALNLSSALLTPETALMLKTFPFCEFNSLR
ncbi:cytochrome P450 [Suillus discolor]|uniref:Cytochrome P450 n=1 Tax=Suillus discolor TaxID=1912936 RepID=A0A9P7JLM8_9AGAM|nr:cytochrome P450 [Suillus discolor]KAG2087126.1 cytochrome P450 [Suillus discolor]